MTPRQIWAATGLLGGLLTLLLWTQAPDAGPTPAEVRSVQAPRVPQLAGLDPHALDQEAATLLATSSLWGPRVQAAAVAASAAPAPPPRWFISGVYQVGSEVRAVLHYEDNRAPAQQLRQGDSLPDGRRLVALDRGGVTLRHTPASLRAARKLAREQAAGRTPAPVALEEYVPVPRRR